MKEEAKKSYPFYDYLAFVWKKKQWLLMIPLIAIVIAIMISLFQKPTYEGTALFNVGDSTHDKVTVPDIIIANYHSLLPSDLQASLQVIVPKYKQVQIQLSGTNKDEVNRGFQKVVNAYYVDLQKVYQQHVKLTQNYIVTLQQRITTLEQVKKTVKLSAVSSQNLEAITNLESELSTRQEQLQMSKLELNSFQSPVIVQPLSVKDLAVTEKTSPLKANLVVALITGLLIAIVVITLWKYALDAKIYQNKQQ